jgi:hypothetical protein
MEWAKWSLVPQARRCRCDDQPLIVEIAARCSRGAIGFNSGCLVRHEAVPAVVSSGRSRRDVSGLVS